MDGKTKPNAFVSLVKNMPEGYLKQMAERSKDMGTYGIYSHEVNGDMKERAKIVREIFSDLLKMG